VTKKIQKVPKGARVPCVPLLAAPLRRHMRHRGDFNVEFTELTTF